MPDNLRAAHERNDETLEKLFEHYMKMTVKLPVVQKAAGKGRVRRSS